MSQDTENHLLENLCYAAAHLVTEADAAKNIANATWSKTDVAERLHAWFSTTLRQDIESLPEETQPALTNVIAQISVVVGHSVAHPDIRGTLSGWSPDTLGEKLHTRINEKIAEARA